MLGTINCIVPYAEYLIGMLDGSSDDNSDGYFCSLKATHRMGPLFVGILVLMNARSTALTDAFKTRPKRKKHAKRTIIIPKRHQKLLQPSMRLSSIVYFKTS